MPRCQPTRRVRTRGDRHGRGGCVRAPRSYPVGPPNPRRGLTGPHDGAPTFPPAGPGRDRPRAHGSRRNPWRCRRAPSRREAPRQAPPPACQRPRRGRPPLSRSSARPFAAIAPVARRGRRARTPSTHGATRRGSAPAEESPGRPHVLPAPGSGRRVRTPRDGTRGRRSRTARTGSATHPPGRPRRGPTATIVQATVGVPAAHGSGRGWRASRRSRPDDAGADCRALGRSYAAFMATDAPARGRERPGNVPWVVPVAVALALLGLALLLARPEP